MQFENLAPDMDPSGSRELVRVTESENSTSSIQIETVSSVRSPSSHYALADITWDGESESASEAYARILLAKGMGYPLWVPEPPSHPQGHDVEGIRIGDVGVITYDGQFDVLFNVCLPANHPVNYLAPPAFEPMEFDPNRDVETIPNFHPRNCFITSKSIQRKPGSEQYNGTIPGKGLIEFDCLPSEGALLILPDGATRINHRFRGAMLEYARQHTPSWYAYVNGNLGLGGQNGSLYLITGTDTAGNWCLAGYSGSTRPMGLCLRYTENACDTTAGTKTIQYSWESSGFVEARSCQSSGPANQSVFIRGYRLSLGKHIFDERYYGPVGSPIATTAKQSDSVASMFLRWLLRTWPFSGFVGGSAPVPVQSNTANDPDVIVEMFPKLSEPYHPSTIINQYLLDQNPDMDVAITHDDEWCAVVNEGDAAVPEGPELLRRIFKQYQSQKEADCIFLAPKDKMETEIHPSPGEGSSSATE